MIAAALTVIIGIGVGLFFSQGPRIHNSQPMLAQNADPGCAVGDLQTLDNNHDLYANFDLLDDMDLQQDVTANP